MNIASKSECLFEMSDINIATALLTSGIPLIGINRHDPQHCLFLFEDSKKVRQIVEDYWARSLSFEPQALLGILKSLKGRLYTENV